MQLFVSKLCPLLENVLCTPITILFFTIYITQRIWHVGGTGSPITTKVKRPRARSGWLTPRERAGRRWIIYYIVSICISECLSTLPNNARFLWPIEWWIEDLELSMALFLFLFILSSFPLTLIVFFAETPFCVTIMIIILCSMLYINPYVWDCLNYKT